jgi:hypothetical protein
MNTCASCAHWCANEQIEVPPEKRPAQPFVLFGITLFKDTGDYWADATHSIIRDGIIRRNRRGVCSRFPKYTLTDKEYVCGEYTEKEQPK